MAMVRFPADGYAALELNQVSFPDTRKIISQMPLGTEFTASNPCENGMWVGANKATGSLHAPVITVSSTTTTHPVGIVYTSEKVYSSNDYGLKKFAQVAGDYPRVGILTLGDTVTTNCLQYDNTEYTTETALNTALAAWATTPVYIVPVANSCVPKITATKPASGFYAQVCKYYTMPDGQNGVKYEVVHM